MKFILLTVGFFVLIISSCFEKKSGAKGSAESKDSVTNEISELTMTDTSFRIEKSEKMNRIFNLLSLENGFEGLEIRIWIGCAVEKSQSLILIRNQGVRWDAQFYKYTFLLGKDDGGEGVDDTSFEIRDIVVDEQKPKSGWPTFSKKLLKLGIENLPNYATFYPNYNFPTDAESVFVEIGKLNKYTSYEYPELPLNIGIADGPAQLEKALQLIESEFLYKRPCQ